jgi:hypothetical protein|tara:strand:- start:285 stop:1493 length:1209 start_codon:yes stop_codon:yes gene_type:complete
MNLFKKITLFVFALSSSFTSFAQTVEYSSFLNTITTAVPFLLIGPDSRSGGMGDIGVATSPDASSSYWNVSKTAFMEKEKALSISYTPWLRSLVPDINLAHLAYTWKFKERIYFSHALRYFSLGKINFTDDTGNAIQEVNPNELALDLIGVGYRMSEHFSGGFNFRYIYSNLTAGAQLNGVESKAGQAVAADLNGMYLNKVKLGKYETDISFGFNIQNIGNKVSYSESSEKNFIPMNLKLGGGINLKLDEYNKMGFYLDVNKLLVPTPPVYKSDGSNNPIEVNGEYVIEKGMNPNVSIAQAIFQSFYDAPGGAKEEFNEINWAIGMEYWYDKQFAIRAGYFYENPNKGNRQHFTLGAGLKYNVFNLDFSYLIPLIQTNPLGNTLRFTMSFDFAAITNTEEVN